MCVQLRLGHDQLALITPVHRHPLHVVGGTSTNGVLGLFLIGHDLGLPDDVRVPDRSGVVHGIRDRVNLDRTFSFDLQVFLPKFTL